MKTSSPGQVNKIASKQDSDVLKRMSMLWQEQLEILQ